MDRAVTALLADEPVAVPPTLAGELATARAIRAGLPVVPPGAALRGGPRPPAGCGRVPLRRSPAHRVRSASPPPGPDWRGWIGRGEHGQRGGHGVAAGAPAAMKIKFPFTRRAAPADTWTKCPRCENQLFNRQLERSQRVCPTCNHHFRLTAPERIEPAARPELVRGARRGTHQRRPARIRGQQALSRPASSRRAPGPGCPTPPSGAWAGSRASRWRIGLFDFRFMGGSMGSVVGEKVARCFEGALAERVPP